jgi:hypothetical protein
MIKQVLLTALITMSIFNLFGQNNKTENDFKFKDSENKAIFTCNHVLAGEPILYATHDIDGDWQFLCGHDNHTEENAKIISLKQVVELDKTVNDLYEMPQGVGAERDSIGAKWIPFKLQEEYSNGDEK